MQSLLFIFVFILSTIWGELNTDSWKWISKQALYCQFLLLYRLLKKKPLTTLLAFYLECAKFSYFYRLYLELWNMNYHHYPGENVAIGFLDHFDHSVFLAFSSLNM